MFYWLKIVYSIFCILRYWVHGEDIPESVIKKVKIIFKNEMVNLIFKPMEGKYTRNNFLLDLIFLSYDFFMRIILSILFSLGVNFYSLVPQHPLSEVRRRIVHRGKFLAERRWLFSKFLLCGSSDFVDSKVLLILL